MCHILLLIWMCRAASMTVVAICLILALPVSSCLCYCEHLIYVDSSQTAWCQRLLLLGRRLQLPASLSTWPSKEPSTTTTPSPSSGQHQLHSGSETQLRNMSQLAIVGNGRYNTASAGNEPILTTAHVMSKSFTSFCLATLDLVMIIIV